MTAIQTVNQNTVKKKDGTSLFLFSSNPVVDAAVMGLCGAAAGAGISYSNQKRAFKNNDSFTREVQNITEDIAHASKHKPKAVPALEKSLTLLKNKQINIRRLGGAAKLVGLVCFVPQLLFNLLIFGGKKGYDKVKNN